MAGTPVDPRWPRLLGLSVHEFRTPMTVVAGYIRMLLKDRAGPLSDQQKHLLEEAEKSCGRLAALLAEMSDLANLEAKTATFNRSRVDLWPVLTDVISALPPARDMNVAVSFAPSVPSPAVDADAVRLKTALTSVLVSLRREIVTSPELIVRSRSDAWQDAPATWLDIGESTHIAALDGGGASALTTFDEWRGGCGLSLAVARRVIEQHGGAIWSPSNGAKAAAVLVLPHA
jgi:signal transduction histidine kinase